MPARERSPEEVAKIVKKFTEGVTMEELGEQLNVSRARVQQILKKAGVDAKEGGAAKRALKRTQQIEKRRIEQEKIRAKRYGMTVEQFRQFIEENGNGIFMNDPLSPVYGYMNYKRNQMRQYPKVPFKLTFFDWFELWKESGKERTKQHWMIRKDRTKPFERTNMQIVTAGEAIREVRMGEPVAN